jgi:hypothetical protein
MEGGYYSHLFQEFQSLLKEGSELMGRGLSRRAVEKYKTALDMILEHSVEVRKHESCKCSSKLWI